MAIVAGNGPQAIAGASTAGSGTAGAGGAAPAAGASAAAGSGTTADDPKAYAAALDGLLLDVTCAANTPTPLAQGATCLHPDNAQTLMKAVKFAGADGHTYSVKLRVRGIWEPTLINGGQRPDKNPFTVGGMLSSGMGSSDPFSYQQYSIEVSSPKQVYWLNDYQYVAHDIKKADYEATLTIAAGADVTVKMHDGNERQIANWTKDYFEGLPPYADKPGLGQVLHLDVLAVTAQP
jgi:hypothetical protein